MTEDYYVRSIREAAEGRAAADRMADRAFAAEVRRKHGVSVQHLGTRPHRLRAYPRGTNWQGWYAHGKTYREAYENLDRVLSGFAERVSNP